MKMKNIGFLGLGAMGSRMAANLIKEGHHVTVYNRSIAPTLSLKELGAKVAATPKDASQNADFIISMVKDDDASRSIWLDEENGALLSINKDVVLIESSTLTPTWVKMLSEQASKKHAHFIDAPVVGSRPQAEAGQLIYLVGGEASILDRAKPLLMAMGTTIHHVGGVSTGATMKLAVNTLFGIQVAALAETLSWLEKSGISTETIINILNQLPTTSMAMQGIGKLLASGNDAPLFPISLVAKDFAYATNLAHTYNSESPISDVVANLYSNAQAAGFGDKNIVVVKKLYNF
ncbi:MAG: NAD(P)-dependent oxidoreductase [Cyanobacteria bacterium]|nr:NAD(P)-dependent oxidoreductase [Cyanobacteriota bacterium]